MKMGAILRAFMIPASEPEGLAEADARMVEAEDCARRALQRAQSIRQAIDPRTKSDRDLGELIRGLKDADELMREALDAD